MKAILNASPIIAILDEIAVADLFLLLCRLDWQLAVPCYVSQKEILKPPATQTLNDLISRGVLTEIADPPADLLSGFLDENPDLEMGESCVLLCCLRLKAEGSDVKAVLDDGPARDKAQALGIPLIGTLGILSLLEKRNLISKDRASQFRRALASSRFRMGQELLRRTEDRVA